MKKIIFIIAFLICSAGMYAQSASEIYSYAITSFNKKDYVKAYELFEKFFNEYKLQDELYASAKVYSAETLLKLGQYGAAASSYEYFINNFKLSSQRISALYKLGMIYFEIEEYFHSRRILFKLVSDYPLNDFKGQALYWIAESYAEEGNLEEAADYFEQAVDVGRENRYIDQSVYSLAHTYELLGDYEKAVEYYDMLLSYYPDSHLIPEAQIRIGICYFRMGEYDHSILELSNPRIGSMPREKQAEANYLLANSYYRNEEYQLAADTYLQILQKYPESEITDDVKYAQAWSYFQLKRYYDAYVIFNYLSQKEGSLAEKSFYWKGEAKRYDGDLAEAQRIYEEFLGLYPQSKYVPAVKFQLGLIFYNRNRYDTAAQLLEAAAASGDPAISGKSYMLLGEIKLSRKKYNDAYGNFDLALTFKGISEDTRLRSRLGMSITYYYSKDYQKAVRLLRQIREDAPAFERDKVNFYLAESNFALEEFNNALEFYNEINMENEELALQTSYGKACAFYNLGQYLKSAFEFADFLNEYPGDKRKKDALLKLGNSYFANKDYRAAVQTYGELLNSGGDIENVDFVLYQYAVALFQDGRAGEAVSQLRYLMRAYPYSSYNESSHFMIGWIYFQQGSFEKAIDTYGNLLAKTRNQEMVPLLYYSIGDSWYNLGEYEKAIDRYQLILDEFDDSRWVFDAVNGMQYSYIALGEFETAVELIDNFLQNHPGRDFNDQLYLKKGELYYSLADYENALAVYKDFISRYPRSEFLPEAYYRAGKSAQNLELSDEAIGYFKTCFNNFRKSEFAAASAIEIAAIHNSREEYAEAVKIMDEAIKKLDQNERIPEIFFTKAEALLMKGDISNAHEVFSEIIIYFSSTIFAQKAKLEIGIIEVAAERYDEAISNFTALLEERTDEIAAEAGYFLGIAYFEQGKTDEAITAFVRVINAFNTYSDWSAKAKLKLGECYELKEEYRKAEDLYGDVLAEHKGTELGDEAMKKLRKVKQK